ncbi:hypothetical protein [Arsukibacterium indicum]|uniref:Uncharacterized protein n=1 Tax=Arsukibacterium indicum TaxID=2848612 RepID=A0ABS6MMV9_9GAMM|nr:hypothetical protein [Arsukibacterium indicum]MBV2129709.1 hypothetical protein [Arsukibacterium indicum]
MIFENARGGIYIHGNTEINIPDYDPSQIFSAEESEFKAKLIDALVKCYRTGLLVNIRRHIAVSKVSEFSEKCMFEWNNEQVSLADAEIIIKMNIEIYYFKTSLIYNVFRHGYKPDNCLINIIIQQFG